MKNLPLSVTPLALAAILALAAAPTAAQSVDFPDSTVSASPQLFFPFYTLGGGGTVRYQVMCPATFGAPPAQPTIVTRVGLPIAGQERYARFEIRVGTSPRQSLNHTWADNLPDQRVQVDLSGQVLPGGMVAGAPATQWVEFDLAHPFLWTPGESVTVDITSSAAIPGAWCGTSVGSHERLYDAPYSAGPTAGTLSPTNGLKFRIGFDSSPFPTYGTGCPGSGGHTPAIAATGSATAGAIVPIHMTGGLGGAAVGRLFGLSRTAAPFGALPLDIGGCQILNSIDAWDLHFSAGSGAGNGTLTTVVVVPTDPSLIGLAAFLQYAVADGASPATIPVAVTPGLILLVR